MEPVIQGLLLVLDPYNIALIFGGVVIGVIVGALPGLSSPMAVALLLPFTITLDPVPAICMMAALYCAGTFGGSITAILINAPGAPPAAATAIGTDLSDTDGTTNLGDSSSSDTAAAIARAAANFMLSAMSMAPTSSAPRKEIGSAPV